MPTDHDVVGDLHEIIDFCPLPDHRAAKSRPIQRTIGANLDIGADNHGTDLRDFFMAALVKFITKTIGTNYGSGLEPDTLAQGALGRDDAAWHQPAIVAQDGTSPDKHLGLQMNAFTEASAGFDHAKGTDGSRGRDDRARRHASRGMHASGGLWPERLLDASADLSEGYRWIFDQDE
jgi:hypothetical protein